MISEAVASSVPEHILWSDMQTHYLYRTGYTEYSYVHIANISRTYDGNVRSMRFCIISTDTVEIVVKSAAESSESTKSAAESAKFANGIVSKKLIRLFRIY